MFVNDQKALGGVGIGAGTRSEDEQGGKAEAHAAADACRNKLRIQAADTSAGSGWRGVRVLDACWLEEVVGPRLRSGVA